jgi:peptidoglycan/LPS O-acetylase OafA/YrhL
MRPSRATRSVALSNCESEALLTLFSAMGLFRLALAWSVLVQHSRGHGFLGLGFLSGQLAVQSFFIISGFYMALVLNEKYTGPGRYWTFLQQRFLRLYPAYIIILLILLLLDGTTSLATGVPFVSLQPWFENSHVITPAMAVLFVETNLNLLGQDLFSLLQLDQVTGHLSFFNTTGHPTMSAHYFLLNRPSWTLGVELSFYILAPLLVCRSARLQTSVLLASLVLRCLVPYLIEGKPLGSYVLGSGTPWTYVFFPSNLCFFLAGSLGYLFYRRNRSWIEATLSSRKWILFLFGAFVVTYNRLPMTHLLYLIFIPIVCLMVPVLFAVTRNNHSDRLIGELSYPFYLIHEHVLFYMHNLFADRAQWIYVPCCVALTMLLSYLFYRFIETKTEHYREGLYQRAKNKKLNSKKAPMLNTTISQVVSEPSLPPS